MRTSRPGRGCERGIAMAMALFTLTALLLCTTSSLLAGAANLHATRNYRGATQVHLVAESAIAEALQRVNGAGVVDFQNDLVGSWASVWGAATHPFGPLPGFSYTVTPIADAADPAGAGRLTAVASGVDGVRHVVVANVVRSTVPSTVPGALYLATDELTATVFQSSPFAIDGTDHDLLGGAGSAEPVPGIATRTDVNTQGALDSLSPSQAGAIRGRGFVPGPPTVASVLTSPAAPTAEQVDRFLEDILAHPRPADRTAAAVDTRLTLGTPEAPEISHFTGAGGLVIEAGGELDGAGIMIVEGNLEVLGRLGFKGIVLVRGALAVGAEVTVLTPAVSEPVSPEATIYGSVWAEGLALHGGSGLIYYSSQALALANQVSNGGALPAPLRVVALADCAQLPPGAGGCP